MWPKIRPLPFTVITRALASETTSEPSPAAAVGLVTAAAADAPEISSALVALAHGEKQVSLGVVLGSNAFNLAAMIGLSAILAGTVSLHREALVLEGAVGLLATLVAAAL